MKASVSKSRFKPKALEYFRTVERTGKELIITDHGRPVLKIVPFAASSQDALRTLRGSLLRYDDPTEPVALDAWEAFK